MTNKNESSEREGQNESRLFWPFFPPVFAFISVWFFFSCRCSCCKIFSAAVAAIFLLARPLRWAATKDIAKLILCTAAAAAATSAQQWQQHQQHKNCHPKWQEKLCANNVTWKMFFAHRGLRGGGVVRPSSSWGLGLKPPFFFSVLGGVAFSTN